jgi:hypothetical protein
MRYVVVLALAVGSGLIGIASSAAATAAGPNGAGTNCHGVSVQSVQADADVLCTL